MNKPVGIDDALAVTKDGDRWMTRVAEGYDVFGIPHGGYVAALAANAVLHASKAPDLFTVTVHFIKKSQVGPLSFEVTPLGASRRFATWLAVGKQNDVPVVTCMASVGDRTAIDGPTWSSLVAPKAPTPAPAEERITNVPGIAQLGRLELDPATIPFVRGEKAKTAFMRGSSEFETTSALTGLIACDVTPPAAWNALGSQGWVPTVELTAHIRTRPAPGPMTLHVETRHVADGFLEEDALVFDSAGALFVQSRQLARWTGQ
ncbi:MAG: thioesterase family protein [Myxococcota bacterium]